MITCLCDSFYNKVAEATVEVLEHLGCHVEFPEGQTCCGQPAFNSADWDATRKVARHTCKTFDANKPVVLPSGSCAHMVQHGYDLAFEKEQDRSAAQDMGSKTWEICLRRANRTGMPWLARVLGRDDTHFLLSR